MTFALVDEFAVLLTTRILSGCFQVFVTIYWPVWVDAFASTEAQKGLWMTIILLASIFAYVVGYGLILVADSLGSWKIAFYTMIAIAVPFIIWIYFIPLRYLDPLLAPERKEPVPASDEIHEKQTTPTSKARDSS